MMKAKRTWIVLFIIALTLIVILAGCSGVPKIAQLGIVADPDPVPCSSEDGKWYYMMNISESNGVGVTIASLTFTNYNQENELADTTILDAEEFFEWFETDYIPAFSTIQNGIEHSGTSVYSIVRVAGIDDNDNPVEATIRCKWQVEMHLARKTILHLLERKKWLNPPLLF